MRAGKGPPHLAERYFVSKPDGGAPGTPVGLPVQARYQSTLPSPSLRPSNGVVPGAAQGVFGHSLDSISGNRGCGPGSRSRFRLCPPPIRSRSVAPVHRSRATLRSDVSTPLRVAYVGTQPEANHSHCYPIAFPRTYESGRGQRCGNREAASESIRLCHQSVSRLCPAACYSANVPAAGAAAELLRAGKCSPVGQAIRESNPMP